MNKSTPVYDGYLLVGDTEALSMGGLIEVSGHPEAEAALERLRISCDERIPQSAQGYLSDLINPHATRELKIDRVRMLRKYVTICYRGE